MDVPAVIGALEVAIARDVLVVLMSNNVIMVAMSILGVHMSELHLLITDVHKEVEVVIAPIINA